MKLTLSSLLLTLCLLSSTAISETVTTGNLLTNSTFGTGNTTTTTGWSTGGDHGIHTHGEWGFPYGTGMDDSGGVLAFEGHEEDNVYQDVDLVGDDHLTQYQINQGFTSTMAADVWFWNSIENTLTLKQTITGADGSVTTQIREINDHDPSRSMNGGQFTNYTNVYIQGSNTQTDITIRAEVYNETAGTTYDNYHRGPDVDNVTLNVTYTNLPPIDENTQEELDDITEDIESDIPDFEEDFTWEENFTWEEDYFTWEEDFYFEEDFSMEWEEFDTTWDDYGMEFDDDMYFEMEEEFVEMEMPEEFEEFDMTMMPEEEFTEMYFEEEFDEGAFMEMPEEFEEMEMVEEFEEMPEEFTEMEMEEEFTEMEMEEEFEEMEVMEEEPTEMEVVEEEETIDMEGETEEDVVEMEGEDEEMEVAENDDTMESPKEDEESSEGNEEAVEEEPESEESSPKAVEDEEETITETDVADEGGITTKNIEVSKEIKIKNVDIGEIKVSVDPRDIFKEVVSLDSYSNKDFYQDKGLQYEVNDDFFDQLSMIEYSKEIYEGVTLVTYIQGDPVEVYRRELEELAIQKAGIMIELKLLRGE